MPYFLHSQGTGEFLQYETLELLMKKLKSDVDAGEPPEQFTIIKGVLCRLSVETVINLQEPE